MKVLGILGSPRMGGNSDVLSPKKGRLQRMRRRRKKPVSWVKKGPPPSDLVKFFDAKKEIYGTMEFKSMRKEETG